MFFWQTLILLEIPIFIFAVFFTYSFINNTKSIPNTYKITALLLYLSAVISVPTKYVITSYDIVNCVGTYGNVWGITYVFEILAVIFIAYICIKKYTSRQKDIPGSEIILIGSGVIAFLSFFIFSNIFANLTGNYEINFIGPIGLTIFASILSIIMLKFKAFNIKTFGSQVLIIALIILIGSQFFYATNTASVVLTAVTLVVTGVIGINLMRSVKKEIDLREKIEKTEKDLEVANAHLKELDIQKTEFISFATHQLRGPLTAVKGYASLLIEGDYGEMSAQVKDAIKVIYESTQSLLLIVGDYLNISRMEQGRMKYDLAEFDLKVLVEETVRELGPNLSYAGLSLNFENVKDPCIVNADRGKIKEVISNLIDNATKYTKKGGINIKLEKINQDRCRLMIKDTGIGIPPEVMPKLFEKFSRAPDASKTNIMGTGLGLFVAKTIIEQHKGRVWAESEGAGKGSTFIIELRLVNPDSHIPEAVKKFAEGL